MPTATPHPATSSPPSWRTKRRVPQDAPVQEFVPLLVENQTRDELRERGLKVDWSAYEGADGPDAEPDADADADDS